MPQGSSTKHLVVAVDMDGMLLSFPSFFKGFFTCVQAGGNKVGILTARPEKDKEQNLANLKVLGITPVFYVGKSDDTDLSDGTFKAAVCIELGIDLLFDDFESSSPRTTGDFFAINSTKSSLVRWHHVLRTTGRNRRGCASECLRLSDVAAVVYVNRTAGE